MSLVVLERGRVGAIVAVVAVVVVVDVMVGLVGCWVSVVGCWDVCLPKVLVGWIVMLAAMGLLQIC